MRLFSRCALSRCALPRYARASCLALAGVMMTLGLSACNLGGSKDNYDMFGALTDGAAAESRFAIMLPLLLAGIEGPVVAVVVDEIHVAGSTDNAAASVSIRNNTDQTAGQTDFLVEVPLGDANTPSDPGILGGTREIDMSIKVDMSLAPMTVTFNP